MLNQVGGSKTDTLVKLVLIFFISLLSFSVGTFVGKQFSDSQHKMTALEGEDGNRETASVDDAGLDVKPEDALTDEDVTNLADEFINSEKKNLGETAEVAKRDAKEHGEDVKDDSHGEKHDSEKPEEKVATKDHRKPASKPEPAKSETAKAADVVTKTAEKVAAGKVPVEETKKVETKHAEKLPAQVASDTAGKYTVQLSSHNNQEDAEKMASDFKGKGYSAFYVSAKVKDATWYRVSVGLFSDKKAAEDYRKKLIADGAVKSAIVQKIVDTK